MLFYSRKNKRTLLFVLSVCYQERKRLFRTEFEGRKMQSNWTGNCPQDVLTEILLRLPVKSLLRFKCVCKYWYAVIGSPGFVRKHFNHENNRTRLLYYTSDNDREGVSFLPDETLLGISSPNDVIDYIQCPQIEAHLIGPIDGLFFVHKCGYDSAEPMALWNPSTREFRPLPMSPITPPYFYTEHTFGFGLDPLTGNYKVIWIRFMVYDRTGNPLPYFVVAVYTLGSDTWRYLDPLTHTTCSLHNSLSATCINGAYYWLVSYDHAKHSILAFDMRCEDFKHIEGPDHPEGKQGSLALCIDYIALFLCQTGVLFQSSIDIWVMKEEGCWDKLVIVEPSVEVSRPLGFWNDEVFLESSSSELFLYKHDAHEIRNLGIYGDNKAVFCYKESLLSVKVQNEDPQRRYFSDIVGDDLKYIVPAAKRKGTCYHCVSNLLNCLCVISNITNA